MDKRKIVSLLGCGITYFASSRVIVSPENSSLVDKSLFSTLVKRVLSEGIEAYGAVVGFKTLVLLAIAVCIFMDWKRRSVKILLPAVICLTLIKWYIEFSWAPAMADAPVNLRLFVIVIFIVGLTMAYQSLRSKEP